MERSAAVGWVNWGRFTTVWISSSTELSAVSTLTYSISGSDLTSHDLIQLGHYVNRSNLRWPCPGRSGEPLPNWIAPQYSFSGLASVTKLQTRMLPHLTTIYCVMSASELHRWMCKLILHEVGWWGKLKHSEETKPNTRWTVRKLRTAESSMIWQMKLGSSINQDANHQTSKSLMQPNTFIIMVLLVSGVTVSMLRLFCWLILWCKNYATGLNHLLTHITLCACLMSQRAIILPDYWPSYGSSGRWQRCTAF